MKPLSEKIIRPIFEADIDKGRINRKLIQNIFFIDIDRPKKMNGFTPYMFEQMAQAFTEYEHEDNALCAIVYTSGDNFCAGMDLKKMKKHLKNGDHSYIKNKKFIDPLGLNKPLRSKPLIVATTFVTVSLVLIPTVVPLIVMLRGFANVGLDFVPLTVGQLFVQCYFSHVERVSFDLIECLCSFQKCRIGTLQSFCLLHSLCDFLHIPTTLFFDRNLCALTLGTFLSCDDIQDTVCV